MSVQTCVGKRPNQVDETLVTANFLGMRHKADEHLMQHFPDQFFVAKLASRTSEHGVEA